ncbi:KAT8 regulatory NSL complex subunit 1-like protein isoform X2 [Coregonus clupeaformis]|uniref:KAT8 regulatory NSL complex subunit 1-like protein isoform X2 n=1 Tax=Coregonus clupeaformis TaxID=59861 RepID=UPI001E1C5423|nr:KAT8 regulatory NSL complex subunit 1-like protein isoform X2 [Coregonus clupeaformis]
MAPALTKLSKEDHGIHLGSSNMDADGAMLNIECDPQLKLMEDSYAQRVWLNFSSLPFLDTCCSSKSPLDFPESLLSPLLQASAGQYKTVLLSSPGSLLSLLALNKTLKHSLVACPGAQDIYFVPIPEHNSQGVAQQQQQCQHSGHGPDGYDIPQSPSKHGPGDLMSQYNPAVLTPLIERQEERGSSSTVTAPAQLWARGARSQVQEQPVTALVEEVVREQTHWHLSQQAAQLGRAGRLQRRLQALLGDHASRHCSLQLEGLKGSQGRETPGPPSPPADTKPFDTAMGQRQTGTLSRRTQGPALLQTSLPPSPSTDIQEFTRYAQVVLRGVQEAVDSDATESSSDEELEPQQKWGTTSRSVHGCEWRWQRERAEVGSRWTWLQLYVAKLEGRIQQLGDLHKHITSTKGGVVLADSQPMTDGQIQQTLLTETAGLSFTSRGSARDPPSDMENEPSSPTRLLRNIQRQSVQLSQIVNSLMPPLNLSPSSSLISCRWKGQNKRAFSSGLALGGCDPFSQKGLKRRRVNRRRQRLLQMDATCVSARTRPLVTYHKPQLFINTSHRQQDLASLSSSSSSFCLTCASCDPLALCSDPACSSSSALTSRTSHTVPHPALSLTSGCRHSHKQHGRHLRGGARGMSTIRWVGSAQTPHRRAYRGGRKRKHTHRTMEDEEDLLSQLSDPEDSPEDSLEDAVTPQTSHTRKRGPIRRRQGESVYNIDNIVIPMSLAATTKVERLQYRDIITPSWRVIDNPPLEEGRGGGGGRGAAL